MEITEEAARIGGFHDDLTVRLLLWHDWHVACGYWHVTVNMTPDVRPQVAVAIFDDAALISRQIAAGVSVCLCVYLCVSVLQFAA